MSESVRDASRRIGNHVVKMHEIEKAARWYRAWKLIHYELGASAQGSIWHQKSLLRMETAWNRLNKLL